MASAGFRARLDIKGSLRGFVGAAESCLSRCVAHDQRGLCVRVVIGCGRRGRYSRGMHEESVGRRLDSLTQLRFVCAAAVLLGHTVGNFLPDTPANRITTHGYVGVTFFFVLSGFVLTWTWRDGSRAAFWRRRAARILPLHLATWCIALVVIAGAFTSWRNVLAGGLLLQG